MSEARRSIRGRSISCELWSINRWLRYTGLRLYVGLADEGVGTGPTIIGLAFWGWKDWE